MTKKITFVIGLLTGILLIGITQPRSEMTACQAARTYMSKLHAVVGNSHGMDRERRLSDLRIEYNSIMNQIYRADRRLGELLTKYDILMPECINMSRSGLPPTAVPICGEAKKVQNIIHGMCP